MDNIILQHFDGELRELDKLSIENIKAYAKRIDVDYKLIRGKPFRKHLTPPCQKVYMIDHEFDYYDNVLMLDIDMFTTKNLEDNIFNHKGIGQHTHVQTSLHRRLANAYPDLASTEYPYWGGAIYKMDRSLRQKLRLGLQGEEDWMDHFNRPYFYEDEAIFHVLCRLTQTDPQYPYLEFRWCQWQFGPIDPGFIHIRTRMDNNRYKVPKIENFKILKSRGQI